MQKSHAKTVSPWESRSSAVNGMPLKYGYMESFALMLKDLFSSPTVQTAFLQH